jgi:CheY-like chemotaxis protein
MTPGKAGNTALRGLRVMIVEDETLVALLLEEYLAECGCVVAGSYTRIEPAMQGLAHSHPDIAILDLNIGGEDIAPVADVLDANGVPYVFASGGSETKINPSLPRHPLLQKPFTVANLRDALLSAMNS